MRAACLRVEKQMAPQDGNATIINAMSVLRGTMSNGAHVAAARVSLSLTASQPAATWPQRLRWCYRAALDSTRSTEA